MFEMSDLKKRVNKIIDNLSIKYDFFYLIKDNKKISLFLFLFYTGFVSFILIKIYKYDSIKGIIENILPFFVDLAVVFLITIVLLILRTIYNDENNRLIESTENIKIDKKYKKYFNISINNIVIDFNKSDYYQQVPLIENLLKWVDFDKDDYFRIHYGSLDISKIAIKSLKIENNKLILNCYQTSFYDISFIHYFPDYKISSSNSKDYIENSYITLRNLLSPNIKKYYENNIPNNNFNLFDLLPNPLGLTGIIQINFIDNNQIKNNFYLLQVRHKSEAAAKNKIQWSFAGTIDVIPNLYQDKITFQDFIADELDDEVLKKEKLFNSLVDEKYNATLIGLVFNQLYLYQPEFFVKIEYNLNINKFLSLKNKLEKIENKFINKKSIEGDIISLSSLEKIQEYIINNKDIHVRNLFTHGFDFLKKVNNEFSV